MDVEISDQDKQLWQAYMTASVKVMEKLDHELQERSHLSLTDYQILATLMSSTDRRVRMSDLAEEVLVSRSRLTYRVDRLEKIGYLTREECSDDRRGLWAILSDLGRKAFLKAQPGHEQDLSTWFFEALDTDGKLAISRVSNRIDEKLQGNA